MPSSGFGKRYTTDFTEVHLADKATEDPSEFFTMIFGGEAFVDWYVMSCSIDAA